MPRLIYTNSHQYQLHILFPFLLPVQHEMDMTWLEYG